MDSSPARKIPAPSPVRRTGGKSKARPDSRKNTNTEENAGLKIIPKRVKTKIKMFSKRLGLDLPFLALILILVIIGLIMMFSASYPSALAYTESSYTYLIRQGIFAVAGIAFMIIISYFNYNLWHKLAVPILIAAVILLGLTLVWPTDSGVHRWIGFGMFTIQTSEIAKFALILFLAHWGSLHFKRMDKFSYGFVPPVLIFIVMGGPLLLQPHFSGTVILAMLMGTMMFTSGVKLRYFGLLFLMLGLAILALYVTGKLGYAMDRLNGWGQALTPNLDEDTWNKTYQTRNSLYAIGSGGFWGQGLGQSRQKYLYIPEVQNDFVFAVVCEELGFVGAAIILCLFALLVWRGITISMRAKDNFGTLLGIGLSAQIGYQAILNIMVITDWMPNTGISLPFFSYGGSSLVMLLCQMGIILSISRESNLEKV